MTTRPTPPATGPYAEAHWTGTAWTVRLNPAGQAFLTDWVSAHGTGLGLVCSKMKKLWATLRNLGVSFDDAESLCLVAQVSALCTYDPSRAKFSTYIFRALSFAIRKEITRQVKLASRTTHGGEALEHLTSTDPEPDLSDNEGDTRAAKWLLNQLAPTHSKCLALSLGIGCSPVPIHEIGERFGVSKNRAAGICKEALGKLQELCGAKA